MSKDELEKLSDADLLTFVESTKGKTKDFQKKFNTDFSYTYLINYFQNVRGFEKRWVKQGGDIDGCNFKEQKNENVVDEAEIIELKKTDDIMCRQSYVLSQSVADKWKDFNEGMPFKSLTIDSALTRFMEDVRNGRVVFKLKF